MTHQTEQQIKNVINPENFRLLYLDQKQDLSVTAFKDVAGFSIVKKYPENTEFFRDGNLIFIRIYLDGENICGGVEMVSGTGHKEGRYYLVEAKKYKKKVTGFSFFKEEELVFDSECKKICSKREKKCVSMNEFVDILVKNHISDKLFFKRKIGLFVKNILALLFWLSDRKYSLRDFFQNDISGLQTKRPEEKKKTDPYFKYFEISKNMLFSFTSFIFIGLFVLQYHIKRSSFSVSNPLFVFGFFMMMFVCENLSTFLENKIIECFNGDKKEKVNFIFKLHSFLYGSHVHSFKLKF